MSSHIEDWLYFTNVQYSFTVIYAFLHHKSKWEVYLIAKLIGLVCQGKYNGVNTCIKYL